MSLQEPADLLSSLRSREEDEDDGGPNSFRGALSMLVPLQCLDDTNAQDPNNTSWTDTALSPKLSDKGGSPMMTSPLMSSPLMVSPRALHEVATSVPSASSPLTISGITNDILGIRESPLPSLPPHQQTGPPTTRRSFRFPSGSSDDARFCPNASGLSDDVLPPPPPLESPSRLVPVPNSLLASDRLVSNSNTNGATSTASAPNSVSARTFEKHMERDPQDLPTQDEILRFSLKRMDTRIASARGAGRALDIASPKAPTASEADNLNELPGGEVRTRPGVLPSEANAFPMGPGGTNGAASASRPIPPVPDLTKAAINAMLLKRQTQMLEKLTAKKKEEKQKAARKKEEKEQQWRRAREVVLARAAAAVASGDELEAPPGSFPDQGQAQTAARPAPPPVSSKGSLGVPAILRRRSVPVPAGSGAAAALRLSVGRTGVGALPPVLDSQGGSSEETHDKERGRGRERERVGGNRTRAASVEGTRQQSPSSVNPNQTQTGRPRWVRRAVASPVDSRRPKGSPPQGGGASSPGQGGQVTESSREGEGGKSAAGVDTSPPSSARAGELLSAVIGAQLSCAGELAASSETATQLLSAAIHREKREAVERQKGQSAAAAAAAAAASGKGGKDEDGGVSVERGEGELTAGEGEGERVSREGADGGAQQSAKGMKETSGASRRSQSLALPRRGRFSGEREKEDGNQEGGGEGDEALTPEQLAAKQKEARESLQRFMQRVAENSKRTMKPVYFDASHWKKRNGVDQNAKLFIVMGGYPDLRRALLKRGWVENPDPQSPFFNLKWTMKARDIDHTSLAETQIVNHFQRNTQITTKSGLMHNLRSLLWYEEVDVDTFFPRCYDCGDPNEVADWEEDYQITKAEAVLKLYIYQIKAKARWLRKQRAKAEKNSALGGGGMASFGVLPALLGIGGLPDQKNDSSSAALLASLSRNAGACAVSSTSFPLLPQLHRGKGTGPGDAMGKPARRRLANGEAAELSLTEPRTAPSAPGSRQVSAASSFSTSITATATNDEGHVMTRSASSAASSTASGLRRERLQESKAAGEAKAKPEKKRKKKEKKNKDAPPPVFETKVVEAALEICWRASRDVDETLDDPLEDEKGGLVPPSLWNILKSVDLTDPSTTLRPYSRVEAFKERMEKMRKLKLLRRRKRKAGNGRKKNPGEDSEGGSASAVSDNGEEFHGDEEGSEFRPTRAVSREGWELLTDKERTLLDRVEGALRERKARNPQFEMNGAGNYWIVKPAGKSRGRGVRLLKDFDAIKDVAVTREAHFVVQKYIENPLLVSGRKFDIRQWVLVSDWNPLTVWFFESNYLRFSAETYDVVQFDNRFSHLTNNSVAKYSEKFADCEIEGCMMSGGDFADFLKGSCDGEDVYAKHIMPAIKRYVYFSLSCAQDMVENRRNTFELYGYDFMVDDNLNTWLIEINSSPAMDYSTKVTKLMVKKVMEDAVKVMVDYYSASSKKRESVDTGDFQILHRSKRAMERPPGSLGVSLQVVGEKLSGLPGKKKTERAEKDKEKANSKQQQQQTQGSAEKEKEKESAQSPQTSPASPSALPSPSASSPQAGPTKTMSPNQVTIGIQVGAVCLSPHRKLKPPRDPQPPVE